MSTGRWVHLCECSSLTHSITSAKQRLSVITLWKTRLFILQHVFSFTSATGRCQVVTERMKVHIRCKWPPHALCVAWSPSQSELAYCAQKCVNKVIWGRKNVWGSFSRSCNVYRIQTPLRRTCVSFFTLLLAIFSVTFPDILWQMMLLLVWNFSWSSLHTSRTSACTMNFFLHTALVSGYRMCVQPTCHVGRKINKIIWWWFTIYLSWYQTFVPQPRQPGIHLNKSILYSIWTIWESVWVHTVCVSKCIHVYMGICTAVISYSIRTGMYSCMWVWIHLVTVICELNWTDFVKPKEHTLRHIQPSWPRDPPPPQRVDILMVTKYMFWVVRLGKMPFAGIYSFPVWHLFCIFS